MSYFLAALPLGADTPAYRVVDTRGPWFLGSARWRISLSTLYLAAAACRIAWAGIASRPSLLHVNITGRGSTPRKLLLTAIARAVALPMCCTSMTTITLRMLARGVGPCDA